MEKLNKINEASNKLYFYNQHFMSYISSDFWGPVDFRKSVDNHMKMMEKSVYTLIKDFPIEKLNDEEKERMEDIREVYGVPNLNMELGHLRFNKLNTYDGLRKILRNRIKFGKEPELKDIMGLTAKEIEESKFLGEESLSDVNSFLERSGYEVLK